MPPEDALFPPFQTAALGTIPEPGRLDELHLYHGSRCNRTCNVCCVSGRPGGDHAHFGTETLQAAVRTVARRGSLKIYGGEPTLDSAGLQSAVRQLRELGFEGAITVFSNGVRAPVLIDLLESDPGVSVVLNRGIAMGDGEDPLPESSSQALSSYATSHSGRIFLSHDVVVPIGRLVDSQPAHEDGAGAARCFRCWPVLRSAGGFHACPFAVAYDYPHYALGSTADSPDNVLERFRQFKRWITVEVEPEAGRTGRHPCEVCCTADAPRAIEMRAKG